MLCCEGAVFAWGQAEVGGNCSQVQDRFFRKVRQVHSNKHAFAAILEDGSVVCWGDREFGGDCRKVQSQLKNVQRIEATQTMRLQLF